MHDKYNDESAHLKQFDFFVSGKTVSFKGGPYGSAQSLRYCPNKENLLHFLKNTSGDRGS